MSNIEANQNVSVDNCTSTVKGSSKVDDSSRIDDASEINYTNNADGQRDEIETAKKMKVIRAVTLPSPLEIKQSLRQDVSEECIKLLQEVQRILIPLVGEYLLDRVERIAKELSALSHTFGRYQEVPEEADIGNWNRFVVSDLYFGVDRVEGGDPFTKMVESIIQIKSETLQDLLEQGTELSEIELNVLVYKDITTITQMLNIHP